MNRFILDPEPFQSAQYHCDKHVVKMILEEAQMLSTVHHRYGSNMEGLYKPTHKHHPCTVWAGDTLDNYLYAHDLFMALCGEYTYRYGKIHATSRLMLPLATPPKGIPNEPMTSFPQAMPDQYKHDDPVEGYRAYYRGAKAEFCKWTRRPTPDWW